MKDESERTLAREGLIHPSSLILHPSGSAVARPWVAIQRNPGSGGGSRGAEILELCRRLSALGIRPRLFSHRQTLARRLIGGGFDGLVGLVAAGGDGTVADLINRFPGVPIAVFPTGTENLLAKYLRIPLDGRFVAEMIAGGRTHRMDVGLLNGRRFTLMMSAGFDADVVHRTHARRSGHIQKWNYIQPVLETLRNYEYPELQIEADGGDLSSVRRLSGRLAVIANLPRYAMGLPIAANAIDDDGLLDLRLFERPSELGNRGQGTGTSRQEDGRTARGLRAGFQMLRYLYKVSRREHERLPDVRAGRFRRVRIDCKTPVPIQCDGDPAGWTPVEVSVLPGALTLFVPESPS
jgi:diacylglycerol kinase (ATP)